jgi:hypothetical protein
MIPYFTSVRKNIPPANCIVIRGRLLHGLDLLLVFELRFVITKDGGEKNCPAIPIAPPNSFVKRINSIITFQRAKDRRKREGYSIGWNVWILGPGRLNVVPMLHATQRLVNTAACFRGVKRKALGIQDCHDWFRGIREAGRFAPDKDKASGGVRPLPRPGLLFHSVPATKLSARTDP